MHWKGNFVQLQVRNVRSGAKDAILQSIHYYSIVGAGLNIKTFVWLNRKKSFTFIVLVAKIKLLLRTSEWFSISNISS